MNSKEEQTNSEVTNLKSESSKEEQKVGNNINENAGDNKLDEKSKNIEDEYFVLYALSCNISIVSYGVIPGIFNITLPLVKCLSFSNLLVPVSLFISLNTILTKLLILPVMVLLISIVD